MNKENKSSTNQSFARGALIMTMGMLIVKIMGAFFKIPLAMILGGEGQGYFTSAYNIYNPIYALATAGLPIAVARMVSGDVARRRYKDVKKIHKISTRLFLITGFIGMLLMIIGSYMFAKVSHAPGVVYSIFMLAPTVLFSCMISSYKGYYEGLRNMVPTAMSEIIESVGKVVFGLGISYAVMQYAMNEYSLKGTVFGKICETEEMARGSALPFASAGAVLGITLGSVVGYLYMLIKYKKCGDGITQKDIDESPEPRSARKLMKMIWDISLPIGLGAIIMNLAGVVDSLLVQNRLADIMANSPEVLLNEYNGIIPQGVIDRGTTHTFLWGCFGIMSTITMLIPAVSQGIAISALPSVTTAWVKGKKEGVKSNIESIFKLTTLISVPAGLGLSFLSYPVMDLVYGSARHGADMGEVYIAAHIMAVSGIAVIFASISTPLCSMLQAVGRADLPVKMLTIGVLIKVVLNYTLVGIPEINIQGASVGTLVCYVFVCVSVFYFLCREARIRPDLVSTVVKPLFCGVCCALAAYASQGLISRVISYKVATILAIGIAVTIYILALLLTRTLGEDDLKMLPKGDKIFKILKRYNWV